MLSQILLLVLCCALAPPGQPSFQINVDSSQKHVVYKVTRSGSNFELGIVGANKKVKPVGTIKADKKAPHTYVVSLGDDTQVVSLPGYIREFKGMLAKDDQTWQCTDGNTMRAWRQNGAIVIASSAVRGLTLTVK